MQRGGWLLFSMGVIVAFAGSISGTIIHVPGDSVTIQAGINGALEGDTVLVAVGTYTGEGNWNLDFGGKNIVVKSADGSASTTIDMSGAGYTPAVTFQNEEDSTAVFEGFTLANSIYFLVRCNSSSPTIRGNVFRDNELCCIMTPWSRTPGSVILCESNLAIATQPHIDSNLFYIQGGYAISLKDTGGRVVGNWIEGYDGIGIEVDRGYTYIKSNVITGFVSSNECGCGEYGQSHGMGIQVSGTYVPWVTEDPVVVNNTIADIGDGILIFGGPRPITVTNNVVTARCLSLGIDPFGSQGHIVEYNDFFITGDSCLFAGGYLNDTASYFIGNDGNISADPLFCDSAHGDFHISSASYCASEYNNDELIGVFGVGCNGGYVCGDATGDYAINVGDAVYLISYIFNDGPPPFAVGAGDADCDGETNLGDAIYLINYIFKNGPEPCCP